MDHKYDCMDHIKIIIIINEKKNVIYFVEFYQCIDFNLTIGSKSSKKKMTT